MTNEPQDRRAEDEIVGPVEYVVLEYPSGRVSADAYRLLNAVLGQEVLRLLDVKFVAKAADGSVAPVEPTPELVGDLLGGMLLAVSAPFLQPGRVLDAGALLRPGSLGAVLLLEQSWLAGLHTVLSRDGALLVAHGPVSDEELEVVLRGRPT